MPVAIGNMEGIPILKTKSEIQLREARRSEHSADLPLFGKRFNMEVARETSILRFAHCVRDSAGLLHRW